MIKINNRTRTADAVSLIILFLFLIIPDLDAWAQRGAITESEKIDFLIRNVGKLSNARFIRNGREYSSEAAAAFLRRKWEVHSAKIKTAADFIEKIASFSVTSGKPYMISFKDGRLIRSADYLKGELNKLEQKAPAKT